MTMQQDMLALIKGVESNAWAAELPPEPIFPAALFEIDVQPEKGWTAGATYANFIVTVYLFNPSKSNLMTKATAMRAAFEAYPWLLAEEESGDAAFEDWPEQFAYYMIFRTRGHV